MTAAEEESWDEWDDAMPEHNGACYASTNDAMPEHNGACYSAADNDTADSANSMELIHVFAGKTVRHSDSNTSDHIQLVSRATRSDLHALAGHGVTCGGTRDAVIAVVAAVGAIVAAAGAVVYKKKSHREQRERRLSDDFEMHAVITPVYTTRHSFELSEA
ncbi:hypothetical protein ON010_g9579 [Phytophthora cinnamomi]|nr:hypothetical protein ON010_g9579 [Phytophthora cinnamomi]